MMGKIRIVNPIKVGDVFTSNQGYKMTVVEYNNANDVVVEFEDGGKEIRPIWQFKVGVS